MEVGCDFGIDVSTRKFKYLFKVDLFSRIYVLKKQSLNSVVEEILFCKNLGNGGF